MPGPQNQPDEATLDLLIKQVTEGLSPAEERELDVLDSEAASRYSRGLERAAAAIALAGTRESEPMPQALRERIEAEARAFFNEPASKIVPLTRPPPKVSARPSRWAGAGWWAAAACLALAAVGWWRTPVAPPPVVQAPPATSPSLPRPTGVPPTVVPPTAPTPAEERAALIAHADAVKVTLGATKDPAAAGASGDVVWDPVKQRGFARFVGLKPNDPRLHQYQLWIFDGARDQRYPVDGGVFDVPADSSEVVIPIRAALLVHDAKAFAVTVEKPGGVVVSDRSHVVALGKAG
jgi:hypothetical protein